ncbi:MAG: hypothetical protein HYV97_18595 [Bdellovibrio sp.]|nr:hypothetical protein [Bdellovibrio sp.]
MIKHGTHCEKFQDPKVIRGILVEALLDNDVETFRDVLVAHLRAISKVKLAQKTGLGRQTLYDLIDEKKEFNPTLSTLGTILEAIAA